MKTTKRRRDVGPSNPTLRAHKVRGVTYAYATFNGVERRYGRLDDEAKRLFDEDLAKWLANGRSFCDDTAGDDGSAPFTVADLVREYRAHVNAAHEPDAAWQRNNGDRVRMALDVLVELFGSTPAAEFGPCRYSAVREHLAGIKREVGALRYCRTTLAERLRIVRDAFDFGVTTERIDANLVHALEAAVRQHRKSKAGRPKRKRLPIDRATFEATLPYLPSPVAAILELMWLTPSRPSELVRLRPCNFDRTLDDVWLVELKEHKTADSGAERILKFGPGCIAVLRPFMHRPAKTPLFRPAEAVDESYRRRRAARKTPLYASHAARYERERAARPGSGWWGRPTTLRRCGRPWSAP